MKLGDDDDLDIDDSGFDGEHTARLDFLRANPYKGLYEKNISVNIIGGETKSDLFEDSTTFKPVPYSYILPAESSSPEKSVDDKEMVSYPFEYPGKLDFLVTNPAVTLIGKSIISKPSSNQSALVIIKPHAHTIGTKYLVSSVFRENKVKVVCTGEYSGATLEKLQVFLKQYATFTHYAIEKSSSAINFTTLETNVLFSELQFTSPFSPDEWKTLSFNFVEACSFFNVPDEVVSTLCLVCEATVIVRRGLYVSKLTIDSLNGELQASYPHLKEKLESPRYVVNGFYFTLKSSYDIPTEPHKLAPTVHYMAIEWDGTQLSWNDMLLYVIGSENPKHAASQSIRGRAYQEWKLLGLSKQPSDMVDNCIHMSESAFEGMVEKLTWLPGLTLASDGLAKQMTSAGVPLHALQKWLSNPQIEGVHVFDSMHRLAADQCVKKAVMLAGLISLLIN